MSLWPLRGAQNNVQYVLMELKDVPLAAKRCCEATYKRAFIKNRNEAWNLCFIFLAALLCFMKGG